MIYFTVQMLTFRVEGHIHRLNSTVTLKMEAAGPFETLISTSDVTRCINPEDQILNLHRCKNIKYHVLGFRRI
jgi:hypothetical protein